MNPYSFFYTLSLQFMRHAEIVIIGAGVVGASVAYHLVERGAHDVLILEAEPQQGSGSTGKATGGVRVQFETDVNIRLSLYSIDFFRNWSFDCGYDPKGYLFFATSTKLLEYLRRSVDKQKSLGLNSVDIVDIETIGKIVPGMNCDDIVGGSFGKDDGFIDPLAVMRGFTEGAIRGGAKIEFNKRVTAIEVSGGRVRGVSVGGEFIECDSVVLCSGPLVRRLAATAGIALPVEPQRRQIVYGRSATAPRTDLPMVIDIGTGFHFRPATDPKATPVAGIANGIDFLMAYPDPDEISSECVDFDDEFIVKVHERAKHRAPFLADCEIVREQCRAGLYENTPDHHAVLGGCEIYGLYLACGFSGHGVMHSPATGRALSEIVLDGKSDFIDVSCLSLDRFAKGALLQETSFI